MATNPNTAILCTRYYELLRIERKMQALEAGGVDNWEGYSDSLSEWFKEEERGQILDKYVKIINDVTSEQLATEITHILQQLADDLKGI